MRVSTILMASLFMLASCSSFDGSDQTEDETPTQEQHEQEDVNEKDNEAPDEIDDEESDESEYSKEPDEVEEVELTEEEKLIQSIPASANTSEWNLIFVNPWVAIPEGYVPELTTVDNGFQIDSRIVEQWNAWKNAALNAGHNLYLVSGYRDVDLQAHYFSNTYQSYLNSGFSEDEALSRTKLYLTEPGHSEHHTGLAIDIVDAAWQASGKGLQTAYETQASQQWMVQTMVDYGFILRYPLGKEDITGIQYEPWHFRYVGQEHAQFMVENDLVFEEYVELMNLR